ncbi:MAG: NRDE family protein [Candidatus Woesearchaeota archaeon]|jgi:hypothetical protein
MCTAIVLQSLPYFPYLVGFNRDVPYWRGQESPPHIIEKNYGRLFAPSIRENGKELLWIALNEHDIVGAITERKNQDAEENTESSQSRGTLLAQILPAARSSENVIRSLEHALEDQWYAGHFNLLIIGKTFAKRVIYRGRKNPLDVKDVYPETCHREYVLPNYRGDEINEEFCETGLRKITAVHEFMDSYDRVTTHSFTKLREALRFHSVDDLASRENVCRHRGTGVVETVSSVIIAIPNPKTDTPIFQYVHGNPCNGQWGNYNVIR